MVICENCGKSSTTKAVGYDGEEVEYLCTKNSRNHGKIIMAKDGKNRTK